MKKPKERFHNKTQLTIIKSKMETNYEMTEKNNTNKLTTTIAVTTTTAAITTMPTINNDLSKCHELSNNGLTTKFETITLNESSCSLSPNNSDNNCQHSKIQNTPTSGVNLSNLINKIECDIKSDTSSNLLNLNLSKSNQDVVVNNDDNNLVECKKKTFIDIEGIIMPPQPLHPDTYLNFPHYIDYNNFSTNYSNPSQIAISANKTNIKNASSALALYTSNKENSTNTTTITNINCNMQSLSLNNTNIKSSNMTATNSNTNIKSTPTATTENHQSILSTSSNISKCNEKIDYTLTTSPIINTSSIYSKELLIASKISSDDTATGSTSITLTDQSSINDDMQHSAFNQNNIKYSQNISLQESSSVTTILTEPPPLISVTNHPPQSKFPSQIHNYNSLSSDCLSDAYNFPFNIPASIPANVLQMQKCTFQQLNASNASNASSLKFQDNLLAYKRYLFSPKTQSLDLGSDLEHPAVMRNRNPRLQQEERFYDDSLTLNDVNDVILKNHNQNQLKKENILNDITSAIVTTTTTTTTTIGTSTSTNGDLRRELLQKNADEALNAGRLSPLISFGTSSTASNNSTMSTGESDIAISYNTTTSSTSPSPSDTSINSPSIIKPKLQTALESRPIYPNVPYSPYSSPRSRRRPPLRESRRVSIDKSGSFLQLNQYKLMDQIGQGSYGLVKLAYNEEDSTHYAMKILSKRRLLRKAGLMSRGPKKTTQSPLDRVYREIAVLKKLDHPNVVKLIEVLDDPLEDFLYLVFELVHQGEVLCIPTDKPLNEERAWSVFRDALQGLEYLHYQRIIHADIKPGNLLLGECGQVKMADLGVCNEFLGEDAVMNNGSTAGTPAFRAPETLMPGQNIYSGKAADIWALGATLWSLIYGNVPFVANNIPALYEQIKNDPLVFPDSPKICDELRDLLEKILDKDPSKRITLPKIKEHPWVTSNCKYPLPSEEDNCRLVQVSDEDMSCVVKSIPKLDTLILIKTMLKNHSFQNPFTKSGVSGRAPQRGGSRLERFTRAGRSNSAPGAYHSPLDRQLSLENTLPSLSENVISPSNESSDKLE